MNERFSLVDRQVPYLHEKQIEREARFILDQYELKFERKVTAPVPLEKITEFQLQLTLEFKDMKSLFPFADVHGAIWFEEGIIGIDQSLNPDENPSMLGRYHFTLAHELGHWCLHRQLYKESESANVVRRWCSRARCRLPVQRTQETRGMAGRRICCQPADAKAPRLPGVGRAP